MTTVGYGLCFLFVVQSFSGFVLFGLLGAEVMLAEKRAEVKKDFTFAGTILAVGGKEQVAAMCEMQTEGSLGCFGLTEKLAGVQSGLVVQTTVEWDDEKQRFLLNTPSEGASRNWISQGYTADKAVVIADLTRGMRSSTCSCWESSIR